MSDYSANPEAEQEYKIMELQKELAPIFDGTHITMGHGTPTKENAEQILQEGLYSNQAPDLGTTALPLQNDREGMKATLNWPHQKRKFIVVIMVPNNLRGRIDKYLWDDIGESDKSQLAVAKLPPKFIKGYVDVEQLKFIGNPLFESNPELKTPLVPKDDILDGRKSKYKGPIAIPAPSGNDSSETNDLW